MGDSPLDDVEWKLLRLSEKTAQRLQNSGMAHMKIIEALEKQMYPWEQKHNRLSKESQQQMEKRLYKSGVGEKAVKKDKDEIVAPVEPKHFPSVTKKPRSEKELAFISQLYETPLSLAPKKHEIIKNKYAPKFLEPRPPRPAADVALTTDRLFHALPSSRKAPESSSRPPTARILGALESAEATSRLAVVDVRDRETRRAEAQAQHAWQPRGVPALMQMSRAGGDVDGKLGSSGRTASPRVSRSPAASPVESSKV